MVLATFVLAAGLAFSGASQPDFIHFRTRANAMDGILRLQDVADLDAAPEALKSRAAQLALLRLPVWRSSLILPVSALRRRIFALMPALGPWLPPASEAIIEIHSLRAAQTDISTRPASCLRASAPVAQGSYPTRDELTSTPCPERPDHALVYDAKAGVVRTRHDISAGDIVVGSDKATIAVLAPGDAAYLQAVVGPVKIERSVTALQPAGPGKGFFATTKDGAVFAVPAIGSAR